MGNNMTLNVGIVLSCLPKKYTRTILDFYFLISSLLLLTTVDPSAWLQYIGDTVILE